MTYFSESAGPTSGGPPGTFARIGELATVSLGPGLLARPYAGTNLLASEVTIDAHSEAPVHTHDEEQMGIVTSGTCEFTLGDEMRTLSAGDLYHAPPGVAHGLRTGDDPCTVIDIFSPPRAALLELMGREAP